METQSQASGTLRRERDVALCRSLLYEALALGFRPPSDRTCVRLGTESATSALSEAAALLDSNQETDLAKQTRHLSDPSDAQDPAALRAAYLNLFGHTARGLVPAYETEYGEDTLFQKPQEMSDIAGFLKAFGLVLDPAAHERIDHISCELEFLAFLARKEAHALELGDATMREQTRKATRLFLKDHLARFAPSFARRIQREDPAGFYGALASFCIEFLKSECRRFSAPVGSEALRLRIPIDDRAPMACGGAEACAPGSCGGTEPLADGEEGAE